ncbi:MAG: putative spermidine/putrescine transport system substrate-binding protein [Actinomycetota bacterium]|nr:putative spermidine/putrescine transport system substrate-binding protein [Actinomycetota bacterium]
MIRGRLFAVLTAIMLVAAACGGGDDTTGSNNGTGGDTGGDTSSLPTEIGPGEGALNLIAWVGYVEDGSNDPNYDWVTPFEKDTGCKVKVKYGDTSDEMVQLMRQGGGTVYDGVSASGDASVRLIAGGDVQEINTDLIPTYGDVMSSLQEPGHNTIDGKHYGVPYLWGPNVLMYRTDVVKEAPTSWEPVFSGDSPYAGQVTAYDSPIYIADAALYLKAHNPDLGITDPYELTQDQFDAAIDLLKEQNGVIGKYWVGYADEIDGFAAGDMAIGTSWPYQVNVLQGEKEPVEAVVPDEGVTGWADTWMMSSNAPHPNCMYEWMKWTMEPDVQAEVGGWFGGTPSLTTACDALKDQFGKAADTTYHCGDDAFLSEIALWKTPVPDCGDDRGETCIDYSEWTRAWTEVKG